MLFIEIAIYLQKKITMKNIFMMLIFLPVIAFSQININGNLLEVNFGGESEPKELTKVGNKLFFTGSGFDPVSNSLKKIYVKENLNSPSKSITINNNQYNDIYILGKIGSTVYFILKVNSFSDKQLWKTNGTNAGTSFVKTIDNTENYDISNIVFTDNKFFFTVYNSGANNLWSSDGTAANTQVLGNFQSVYGTSNFVTLNGNLYFSAQNSSNNNVIVKSDGTAAGTIELLTLPLGTQPIYELYASDNYCYFMRKDGSTSNVCRMDENGNIFILKQLQPNQYTLRGGAISGKFIFFARENTVGNNNTYVLNSYEETNNSITSVNSYFYYGGNTVSFKNKLYFDSSDGNNNDISVVTDGTLSGTKSTAQNFGISDLMFVKKSNDSQYLILNDGDDYYVSDGVTVGLKKILKESDTFNFNSPIDFTYYDSSNVVFAGENNDHGNELFVFNNGQSSLLEDIVHNYGTSFVSPTELNGKLVFLGNNFQSGQYEPAVSDGTVSGTKLLKDLNPGGFGSTHYSDNPTYFKNGNKVFFRCSNGIAANEPCVTDGTEVGTKLIKKLGYFNNGSLAEDPYYMSLNDNEVLFAADGNTNNSGGDYNLWKTDGTEAGTVFVHSVYPAKGSYDHKVASTKINGFVYFTGQATLNDDLGIWKTDGTTNGTQAVKTFTGPNNVVLFPKIVAQYNNKIFIVTSHWSTTAQLYVYDTSTNTATLLQTLPTGNMHLYLNKMYFLSLDKIITLNMDNLQFSENIYNPGATGSNNSLQYKQCENNLYLNVYNSTTNTTKFFLVNNQINSPITLNHADITTSECIDNKLLYVARTSGSSFQKIIKITDGSNFTDVNFFYNNQNVDLSNFVYNDIYSIFKIQDKLFFYASLQNINNAGYELYRINDWHQFLKTNENTVSSDNNPELITIYPNPSTDFIKIKSLLNSLTISNVSAFDMSSRQIIIIPTDKTNTEFNIRNLPVGVYILKISTDKGIFHKKFLKN
jgi:ELWxxDGT repeat protein